MARHIGHVLFEGVVLGVARSRCMLFPRRVVNAILDVSPFFLGLKCLLDTNLRAGYQYSWKLGRMLFASEDIDVVLIIRADTRKGGQDAVAEHFDNRAQGIAMIRNGLL